MTLDDLKQRADVDPVTGCWLWRGGRTSFGYGSVTFGGRHLGVHRVAFKLAGKPNPDNLPLDHLCRVRHCFNPDHLEAVSQRVNVLRSPDTVAGKHARKTHCKNGHPFDSGNTIIVNAERGWRDCRACRRARHDRARQRRAEVRP